MSTRKTGDIIHVNDLMQSDYAYLLEAPMGCCFADGFAPALSPSEMLELGVFEGKYCNDCRDEFPSSWFKKARISEVADPTINYFKIKALRAH